MIWLPAVTERGWIIISQDMNISRNLLEREAVRSAGARMFVFASANLRATEKAQIITASLPRIRAIVAKTPAPFTAKMYKDGRVDKWWP